jgi:hypothetical protein
MATNFFAIHSNLVLPGLIVRHEIGPRQPRFNESDELILFERAEQSVLFIGRTSVLQAETLDREAVQSVSFKQITPFEEERELTALAGSLERVYRFLHPERHFRRKIVRLPEQDFQTIVHNKIDVHRSIFRYLFSALPIELRADFVRRHIDLYPLTHKGEVKGYAELCPRLIEYYREYVSGSFNLIHLAVQQFHKLQGIHQLGRLSEFVLTDGSAENPIGFGDTAQRIFQILSDNTVFREEMLLLRKAESELTLETEAVATQQAREWRDPIF